MKIKRDQLKKIIKQILTEALQRLDESERGEWWIYPGGDAEFADGDVGDSNHEGYVIEHVARDIYEHFLGDPPEEMGYLSEYEEELKQALINDERFDEKDAAEWDSRGPTEVIIRKLMEDEAFKDQEQVKEAVYIAWGSSSRDSRDYAMKYLGWKRMTTSGYGTDIQTWTLTQNDFDTIRRGISNAWGDQEEEEGDAEHEVTIEVRANNKVFSGIPLSVIDAGQLSGIVTYQRGSAWMRERQLSRPGPFLSRRTFGPV